MRKIIFNWAKNNKWKAGILAILALTALEMGGKALGPSAAQPFAEAGMQKGLGGKPAPYARVGFEVKF